MLAVSAAAATGATGAEADGGAATALASCELGSEGNCRLRGDDD
jgi:hypothetical protein